MGTSDLRQAIEDARRHVEWQRADGSKDVWVERKAPPPPAPAPMRAPEARLERPGPPRPPPSESGGAQSGLDFARPERAAASVQSAARGPARSIFELPPVQPVSDAERQTLDEIRRELGDCKRCKLCTGRTNLVFGVGNPKAELVFVGEGPGADEDAQGIPFVGKAGQLLTKMIEAMGFARDDVYICNVVKCRPPGNRNPEIDEIQACEPFLRKQLGAIRPKVIVALGKFAAQTLLRDETPITRLRGRWREYCGVALMPTFHPAYLLRSPAEKKNAWADLQQVMKVFGKEPKRS
jgi:uracil-DNA glycosylase family 4